MYVIKYNYFKTDAQWDISEQQEIMKKILLILAMISALSISMFSENVKVIMTDGKEIRGKMITYNESQLIIEPNTFVKYEKSLKPIEVTYFEIEGIGRIYSKDGIFVIDESITQLQNLQSSATDSTKETSNGFWKRVLSERSAKTQSTLPSNPNDVIGRAFLSTGSVALGIGLPCFAAGLITCVVGNVGITDSNIKSKAECVEASYYLFGIGASLTIISIPLLVNGRRIADMKVNYTGNGVGTSVNF